MRIYTEPCTGYLTCRNPECPGTLRQSKVEAIREVVETLYSDLDGMYGGPYAQLVERSHSTFRLANPEDDPCPYCDAETRELTDQIKPKYDRLVQGGGALELLKLRRELAEEEAALEQMLVDARAKKDGTNGAPAKPKRTPAEAA